jgi:hypothetical protein
MEEFMTTRFALLTVLLTCLSVGLAQETSIKCAGPLTEVQITDLVKSYVPEARLKQIVNTCGIQFNLSSEIEKRLRTAGATQAILDFLRQKSPSSEIPANSTPSKDMQSNDQAVAKGKSTDLTAQRSATSATSVSQAKKDDDVERLIAGVLAKGASTGGTSNPPTPTTDSPTPPPTSSLAPQSSPLPSTLKAVVLHHHSNDIGCYGIMTISPSELTFTTLFSYILRPVKYDHGFSAACGSFEFIPNAPEFKAQIIVQNKKYNFTFQDPTKTHNLTDTEMRHFADAIQKCAKRN